MCTTLRHVYTETRYKVLKVSSIKMSSIDLDTMVNIKVGGGVTEASIIAHRGQD